ncbi:hypothetical protein RHMOL_Rhmol05G0242800 [Rhododendron molle]|uniref:Uncharacterized protein n=1 Tax=Rhododendron molle TaxID=49168 RepID=A0ACC0NTR2_RHOML|nr:hypothetical protein RHMOL_Rhmol05G0242800 [Rhododendron molle]
MATRRTYLDKPAYLYLHGGGDPDRKDAAFTSSVTPSDAQFELDESELWDNDIDPSETPFPSESKNPIPASRKPARRVAAAAGDRRPMGPSASLPVNVPDWSKILRGCERRRAVEDGGDEGEEDSEGRIPPHEYLARTRRASFSVHEGNGRTLKGRDLSRVRNAIWKQTGFED